MGSNLRRLKFCSRLILDWCSIRSSEKRPWHMSWWMHLLTCPTLKITFITLLYLIGCLKAVKPFYLFGNIPCPSVYVSVCPSPCLSVCLFTFVSFKRSARSGQDSIIQNFWDPFNFFIYLFSLFLCLSMCLSIFLFISMFLC